MNCLEIGVVAFITLNLHSLDLSCIILFSFLRQVTIVLASNVLLEKDIHLV